MVICIHLSGYSNLNDDIEKSKSSVCSKNNNAALNLIHIERTAQISQNTLGSKRR